MIPPQPHDATEPDAEHLPTKDALASERGSADRTHDVRGWVADLFPTLVGPGVVFAVWCGLTYGGVVDRGSLPAPSDLVGRFVDLATKGYLGVPLPQHVWASLRRTMIGFALAVIIGAPIGVAMGYYGWVDRALRPILSFLRPIPPIAFIPLAVLYLGLGEDSKIALIFFASFIYVTINAEAGARSTPEILLRAARSLGLNSFQVFHRVVLVAALPSLFAGLRVALGVSWAVVVAAELLAAQSGLGYMIQNAGNFFDLGTVYIGIVIIGIIGFLLDTLVVTVQRRLLHWQGK
jgi:NitT/TauT family transport system permease protein